MLVFGKTNDDKGTQLENLTKAILTSLGYSCVVQNVIRSGGSEVDVVADFKLPGLTSHQTHRLFCECKAQKRLNDMTDWLKFLGKVYSEETRQNLPVHAYFISLGGVNGYVTGQYQDFHALKPTITLVDGDSLLRHVESCFAVCKLDAANTSIQRFTNLQPRSFDLAYYEGAVYWVVIFDGSKFTFLQADGEPVAESKAGELKELASDAISAGIYLNLKEKDEARRRGIRVGKSVISCLMLNAGTADRSTIFEFCIEFAEGEVDQAIASLTDMGILAISGDGLHSLPSESSELYLPCLVKLYLFLLGGEITEPIIKSIVSPYHFQRINESFVQYIQSLQAGFRLSSEDVQQVIRLLRLSPSGLYYAIRPDANLVVHRTDVNFDEPMRQVSDSFCSNYFLGQLYLWLRVDFHRRHLLKNFHNFHGARELESVQKIVLKSERGILLEGSWSEVYGYCELADGFVSPDGSKLTIGLALASVPQPWDKPKSEFDGEAKPPS